MKTAHRIFVAVLLFLNVGFITAAEARQIPISPRLQWDENNGYCGETSIQQIALYYGTYASQWRIRAISDQTQQQDLLIETSGPVLEALRLSYEQWDYEDQDVPEFRNFLVWMKQHINGGHPVIMAVYVRGGADMDYDHIVPAIGVDSEDYGSYLPWDTLTFNDNYSQDSITRYFFTLWSTRLMLRGLFFEYCIPRRVDFGCAVTGIRDDKGQALPVSVAVDRWDEPDIAAGEDPVTMQAQVTVGGLEAGKNYALLRYDAYQNVPAADFLTSAYTAKHEFTATGATYTYGDSFASDTIVTYRCVLGN